MSPEEFAKFFSMAEFSEFAYGIKRFYAISLTIKILLLSEALDFNYRAQDYQQGGS